MAARANHVAEAASASVIRWPSLGRSFKLGFVLQRSRIRAFHDVDQGSRFSEPGLTFKPWTFQSSTNGQPSKSSPLAAQISSRQSVALFRITASLVASTCTSETPNFMGRSMRTS